MADTGKTARLADLLRAVKAGKVRHYHWTTPVTRRIDTDAVVTARIRDVGPLVLVPAARHGDYSVVRLSASGEQWLDNHGRGAA